MLSRRLQVSLLYVCAMSAGFAAADAVAVTAVQHAQLDALIHADLEGLEPADYRVDALTALARASGAAAEAQFSETLTGAFGRFARDLAQGRLGPSAEPQWHLPPEDPPAELLSPPPFSVPDDVWAYLDRLMPPHLQYRRLRAVLGRYLDIAGRGGWPVVPAGADLRAGDRDERIVALRNRLRISGHYTAEMQADPLYFDAGLDEGLRRFQAEQGLWADGTLDARTRSALNVDVGSRIEQLRMTLERWRWLPRDLGPRYLWVNVGAQTLAVVEAGQPLLSMRVIVGRPYRQTPSLRGDLNQVTFNPTWTVPFRLAVEDILPQQQRNPAFLSQKHIRVFSLANGREVDPAQIDWAALNRRNFTYQLRQDAGPQNSLGRLKFSFDNPYDIYLHDTPADVLFRLPTRTFSAGCVRVEDPRLLAQYLFSAGDGLSAADIDRAIRAGATRTVTLGKSLPIYLVYLTAWFDDETGLALREDVYGRDRRLGRAWETETARRAAADSD